MKKAQRMAKSPGPFDINTMDAILAPDGAAHVKEITPNFYQELDAVFGGFAGHALVVRHEFSDDWPTWEMHPNGDELVMLLSGDIDFVLWIDGTEETIRVNQANHYIVVPKGVGHTARPHKKTSMLFVTPGEGTLNEERPPP